MFIKCTLGALIIFININTSRTKNVQGAYIQFTCKLKLHSIIEHVTNITCFTITYQYAYSYDMHLTYKNMLWSTCAVHSMYVYIWCMRTHASHSNFVMYPLCKFISYVHPLLNYIACPYEDVHSMYYWCTFNALYE